MEHIIPLPSKGHISLWTDNDQTASVHANLANSVFVDFEYNVATWILCLSAEVY